MTAWLFLVLNRLIFWRLPLHGDFGFFAIWGHFRGETLDHDAITHNGGFRVAGLFFYALFKKLFGSFGAKISSRTGEVFLLGLGFIGYHLLFVKLGFKPAFELAFFASFAILASSFTSSIVYNYTVESLGIACLPWILLLVYCLPFPLALATGIVLALMFKLNLSFEVFFFMVWFGLSTGSGSAADICLGTGLALILYLAWLQVMGMARHSLLGFLAFFTWRNRGFYAWRRLFWPFLWPMLAELFPVLILAFVGAWVCFQTKAILWVLVYFLVEVFGLLIQRGFFHYHYICLIPGLSLLAGCSQALLGLELPFFLFLFVLYTFLRYRFRAKQFWPKSLEHQEIYNYIVDGIAGDKVLMEEIRAARISWFAGWRFQFHPLYDSRPFSVYLQSVKSVMAFSAEDEEHFLPQFKQDLHRRLHSHSPELLIQEEDELLDLQTLRELGYSARYLKTAGGRLKFFRLSCTIPPSLETVEAQADQLFLRYPAQFDMHFFMRITPQYLMQCGTSIALVGSNPNLREIVDYFEARNVKTTLMSQPEFESSSIDEGDFFLIEEGRVNSFYMRVHRRISDRLRIFKYT